MGSNDASNGDLIVYQVDAAGFIRPVLTRSGAFMPATAGMPTYNDLLDAQAGRAVAGEAQKEKRNETQSGSQLEFDQVFHSPPILNDVGKLIWVVVG